MFKCVGRCIGQRSGSDVGVNHPIFKYCLKPHWRSFDGIKRPNSAQGGVDQHATSPGIRLCGTHLAFLLMLEVN